MIDDLLKKTLDDDLPPDVAAAMKSRFDRFRERSRRKRPRPAFRALLSLKTAWAAVSVLMLVLGGFLQGSGSPNALSGRIAAIGTAQTVSRLLTSAETMSCSARIQRSDGTVLSYEIEWRRSSGTSVAILRPDGTTIGKFEAAESGGNLDPALQDAASLLNPSAVRDLLSENWRPVRTSRDGGGEVGTFSALAPDGRTVLEFDVDVGAYLPVRIRRSVIALPETGEAGNRLWEARLAF